MYAFTYCHRLVHSSLKINTNEHHTPQQENLMGLTEHEIGINIPLLEGHRLALFYVRRRMIERVREGKKEKGNGNTCARGKFGKTE